MFKQYRRTGLSEMRPFVPGENLTAVSVSPEDIPLEGGMIARNPKNHDDQWYVAEAYFKDNLELVTEQRENMTFGQAIEAAKKGFRIARIGWNGKDMYLFHNPSSDVVVSAGRPLASAVPVGTPVHMSPYLMMKTADQEFTCVPWLASQTDVLANDWMIVE
jgi:hypothetical protein